MFNTWWETLPLFIQIMYIIAVGSSVLLILQLVLLIIGIGSAADIGGNASDTGGIEGVGDIEAMGDATPIGDLESAEFDSGTPAHSELTAAQIFTLLGISAFFAVFSWGAILMYAANLPTILCLVLGILAGTAVMFGIAKLTVAISKLSEDGTEDLNNAVGKTAEVYIPIIPGKQGKVTVEVQGKLTEADAVSDDDDILGTGTVVMVTALAGDGVLVKRI
jgi:membrane protein implicated in regulation of membrane protease activity